MTSTPSPNSRLIAESVRVQRSTVPAVVDVSHKFKPAAITAVVGENGSGKSTLLDALAGTLTLTSGRISLDGDDIQTLPPITRAQRIASIGQRAPVIDGIDVATRIGHGLAAKRGANVFLDQDAFEIVTTAAKSVGVEAFLTRSLEQLSGGERARVEVARALVDHDAAVVILDEPLAGVDVRHRQRVIQALQNRAKQGATIVVSFHDLAQAFQSAAVVIGIKDGAIIRSGHSSDVLSPDGIREIFAVEGKIVDDGNAVGAVFARDQTGATQE